MGRDQVLVGIVPRLCPLSLSQSAKAVYPLVLANCKENRYLIITQVKIVKL